MGTKNQNPTTHEELVRSLAELREVVAACFRVMERSANRGYLSELLSMELEVAGVRKGFGVRAQRLLERAKIKPARKARKRAVR